MKALKRYIRNLRVQRKLNLVIVVTCAAVLLLACAALYSFQMIQVRKDLGKDLESTASIIAANSMGALTFKDRLAAMHALDSLKAKVHISYARLESTDGTVFCERGIPQGSDGIAMRKTQKGLIDRGDLMILNLPITSDEGELLGTLFLDANIEGIHRDLVKLYGGISLLVLAFSILVGILLSNQLQSLISTPILKLAETARAIAEAKDYSVRANKQGEDEVGLLTDAFNQMLCQIQSDSACLKSMNLELQCEIEERSKTEAARQAADQRFRSLTESATDAIISIDTQGRITSWNKGAQIIFDYEDGEILGELFHELLPERYHAGLTEITRLLEIDGSLDAENNARELHGLRKDDTEVPIELSLYAWKIGSQRFFGAIIRDITERKRVEAELATLNKQVQDNSRQAGMAEVATGVLHNVGNVLNSVNVAATTISDRVKGSRLSNVDRLADLLLAQKDNLSEFVANDPKGRQLGPFLKKLAGYLAAEQSAELKELESLRKNVDHIKEIVAMQQSYAKVSGLMETVSPASLIEDAIRINEGTLAGAGVELVRDYDDVPEVAVDRHKVMQILVNLIRNAKHALDDDHDGERRLTLQIRNTENHGVAIAVVDSGVGIPRENLTRVFQHGFTTKRDGHGFGLHSGANAAKEMGGLLTAHSDGPGRGATFTLELPISVTSVSAQAA